jgi:hypothetical protein
LGGTVTYRSTTPIASRRADGRRTCSRHRTNGEPCRALAIRGANVCYVHGGAAPQVKLAAEERIRALVDPSLNRIAKAIDDDENPQLALAAARDILDRAGYKATEKIQQDGRVTLEIELVKRPLELPES